MATVEPVVSFAVPVPTTIAANQITTAGMGWNIFKGYLSQQFDPDPMRRIAGWAGVATYEKMELDSHVFACTARRKRAIDSRERTVQPSKEGDAEAEKRAEYSRETLSVLNDKAIIHGVMDGKFKGIAGFECVYDPRKDNPLIDVIHRLPQTFDWDEEGNLKFRRNLWAQAEYAPPNKFLIFTNDPKYASPFGTAEFRSIYWDEWFKRNDVRFYVSYLERHVHPFVIFTIRGTIGKEDKELLMKIIKNFSVETGCTLPEGITMELKEPERSSATNAYLDALGFFNAEISKVLLGHAAAADRTMTGSYAEAAIVVAGPTQDILDSDARDVESFYNQIINLVEGLKFGEGPRSKFKVNTQQPEDLVEIAMWLDKLVNLGLAVPEKYVYGKFGVPEPKENEKVETDTEKILVPLGGGGGMAQIGGGLPPGFEDMSTFMRYANRQRRKALRNTAGRSGAIAAAQRAIAEVVGRRNASV